MRDSFSRSQPRAFAHVSVKATRCAPSASPVSARSSFSSAIVRCGCRLMVAALYRVRDAKLLDTENLCSHSVVMSNDQTMMSRRQWVGIVGAPALATALAAFPERAAGSLASASAAPGAVYDVTTFG